MSASVDSLSHLSLIRANTDSLRQALRLLDRLDDQTYQESPPGFAPHRVGGHLRHILEFYECLLNGVESGWVDYDARKRNATIETNLCAARAQVQDIITRIESTPSLHTECMIRVRMEDMREGFVTSSPGRELQVLSSHTIHHFALIAMTLMAHGIGVDPDFGMAPSTLRHLMLHRTAV